MIVSPELARWIADGAAQQATQRAIDRFARQWNASAAHRAFDAALAHLDDPSAEDVAAIVADLFAEDRWLGELIDGLCGALRDDPYLEPPFAALSSDIHSGLMIYDCSHASIAAGVTRADALAAKKDRERSAVSIGFTGRVAVVKFVTSGDALLSFWEAPRIEPGFTAAAAARCRLTDRRRIADGELLIVDGRYQSYVIEHARSNLVVLQATIKAGQAPLSVEYDAMTHDYVGCSAVDDGASRIQMIATLLRKLGRTSAFPAIAAFLDHPDFFVRWHVMRELLGMDAAAALPHLERMAACDPHPDARAAAAAVLGRFAAPPQRKAA